MPGERPADRMGDGAEAGGQLRGDVLIEWYRYAPGPPVALPKHAHADYQLNLNLGAAGGVRYRGAHHVTPAGTLAVIMPEEAHTPVDPDERPTVTTHLTMYVTTDLLRDVARGLGQSASWPWFRHPVIDDPDLVRRFARLHASLSGSSSALDQDARLCEVLTDLVDRHARGPAGAHQSPAAHRAVRRARDHLHDNVTADVSLAELARVGGVSPYHLTRLFTDGVGMPPHAYQVQLRLSLAKRLLATGRSVSDTAHEAGFFDLSHLTRHFKRHVGIPPGAYARRSAPTPPLG